MAHLNERIVEVVSEAPFLILGGQIALGFGVPGAPGGAWLKIIAGVLMLLATALAVAPGGNHRLVTAGTERSSRLQRFTARTRAAALLPLGLALGIDAFILTHDVLGPGPAALTGMPLALWAAGAWLAGTRPVSGERRLETSRLER